MSPLDTPVALALIGAATLALTWFAAAYLACRKPEPAPEPVTWDAHNSINRRPGRR